MIKSDDLRYQDCDEQVLSEKAQKYCPSESNHEEFMDKIVVNQLKGLQERKPEEWLSYEQFVNCMILPKQHDTPNESQELPFLAVNLEKFYRNAKGYLMSRLKPFIHSIHVKIASSSKDSDLMKDFTPFESKEFGFDFAKYCQQNNSNQ